MKGEKPKTADEIFHGMHRELRAWNPDIPESSDRMDPILRIILKLYAGQLEAIDRKIVNTWTVASNALIKSLCPESMRWPVPAFTVMQAEPSDPVIKVDPQTQFFYKEERDDGQTFFFSSLRTEKLLKARLRNLYFTAGDNVHDLSPPPPDGMQVSSRIQPSTFSGRNAAVYMAVEHDGPVDDFEDCIIFLQGNVNLLKQLRWSRWLPCIDGDFYEAGGFCPGAAGTIDDIFSVGGETMDWGGLRRSSDLFKPLEHSFMVIPKDFVTSWRAGDPDKKFLSALERAGHAGPAKEEKLFWIKVLLPSGGDRSVFQSSFRMHFDCFIAVNKYERTLFKHTGGNRLVEIEIPDDLKNILKIISVADSNGRAYIPRHEALNEKDGKFYNLLEQNGRLCLWFDFSSEIELPPDSITVNYSVTAGKDANGISAGKVSELYESHPGIVSLKNIIPVSGAVPAKTEEQIITEISARLRGRDRAMSFDQIVNWTRTFDERITQAECEKGVIVTDGGVRKCVVVKATVREKDFHSADEIELLKTRLGSFLKARTSINSQFKLEIVKT